MADTSEYIAQSLHDALVEECAEDDMPQQFGIPEAGIAEFRAKVKLYREAMILMQLSSESESQTKFKEVLVAFEKLIFDPVPSPRSLEKLNALKKAMSNLDRLLHPEGHSQEFTWAKEWLHEVGHDEYNPAKLTLFSIHWMNAYVCVVQSIRDLGPLI